MKILKYIHVLTAFSLLLAFSSCEDVVDVDLNNEDLELISVEAYLSTHAFNNIFVKIEKSLPVNNPNANPGVNNAIVEISDKLQSQNRAILVEDGQTGIYRLAENEIFRPVPGRTYKLTITTEDGIVITGEDYLQKTEPLDSMKIKLSARGNYDFLGVFINAQETPGTGNYYKWDIFINGKMLFRSEQMSIVDDALVDGNYVYNFEIFTDFYPPNDEEMKVLYLGDSVYVVQNSISKSAYDFYFGMVNQSFTGSPFSVPPASLPGNLSANDGKRVLGLFSARNVSVSNLVVIDSTNYTPIN